MGDSQASEKKGGSAKSLIRDARGAVVVYIALVAPVLFGVGALTLDVGRLITLHTELQAAADAAAIVAARELTKETDSIKNAKEAAAQAVANVQTFATGSKQVIVSTLDCPPNPQLGVPCIRFLKSLPANDQVSIDDPNDPKFPHVTTLDEEAHYVDVHIGARNVTNILVRLLMLMGQNSLVTSTTSATAVAGQDRVICTRAMMFMCSPTEPQGNTDLTRTMTAADWALIKGKQIKSFKQALGGLYEPGNFGLLCPTNDPKCGGANVKGMLAENNPDVCFPLSKAETKTGVTLSAVLTGINARLDHWTEQAKDQGGGSSGRWRNNTDFTPAHNVTQGGLPPANAAGSKPSCKYTNVDSNPVNAANQTEKQWVNADPNNTADNFIPVKTGMGFPRDSCFPDSCSFPPNNTPRVGNGDWDYQDYLITNHSCDTTDPQTPDCKPKNWIVGAPWPPTRFDVYRYELEATFPLPPAPPPAASRDPADSVVVPKQKIYNKDGTPTILTTKEDGHAQCFQKEMPADQTSGYNWLPDQKRNKDLLKDRRVLTIALLNCQALEASGEKNNGKFKFDIPEMALLFITEIMKGQGNDKALYTEMIGTFDEDSSNLVKSVVQIYRRRGQ